MKDAAGSATRYTVDVEAAKDMPVGQLFSALDSSAGGLTGVEAKNRLALCGPNALEEKKRGVLKEIFHFFWGPIPWMIEVAALLSLIASDFNDFYIIMFMLLFNAMIGFWEEHKANNALDALKKGLALQARVLR
ncbi:MAG: cation-transporting P-type ATPase, partial [Victivallales bacterium]|nr:cation-transporting P-type ATPase [Victivallales bacterium]